MKILLMTPPSRYPTYFGERSSIPSLGITYLASYAKKYGGYETKLLDPSAENVTFRNLKDRLLREHPDVVGISFPTENRFDGFDTVKVVKSILPKTRVVAGGVHPSLAGEDLMRHIPELDFTVRGEGEVTFLELLNHLKHGTPASGIRGLIYRENGRLTSNPRREHLQDIDSIPYPAYDLLPMFKYNFDFEFLKPSEHARVHPIMTSRGCPFGCNFCATGLLWGRFRGHSPDYVIGEMRLLKERYDKDIFWIFDDCFTYDPERVHAICDRVISERLPYRFIVQGARVDRIDGGLIRKLKDAGCLKITFGVESGSQVILDNVIHKKITVEQVLNVSRLCSSQGLTAAFAFIVSHPGETPEEARETLELARKIKAHGNLTQLNPLKIYPGTRLERTARERGAIPEDFSWFVDYPRTDSLLGRAIKGRAPFFFDKMNEQTVYDLMARWIRMEGYPIHRHAITLLRRIRSWRDVKTAIRLMWAYLRA